MAIENTCMQCGQRLKAEEEHRGRQARCPICHAIYTVGDVEAPASAQVLQPLSQSDIPPKPVESAIELGSPISVLTPLEDVAQPPNELALGGMNPVPLQEFQGGDSIEPSRLANAFDAVPQWYVRTPDERVYGPGDTNTLMQWFEQRRLNDACFVRRGEAGDWIPFGEWRRATLSSASPNPSTNWAPSASPGNPYAAPVRDPIHPSFSAGPVVSGRGGLILTLGILSLCTTLCGFGWILALVTLIVASQENIASGAAADGRVRVGQTLAIVALLLGALQWLWFLTI